MAKQKNENPAKDALSQLDASLNEQAAENVEKQVESLGRIERIDYADEEVKEVNRLYGWLRVYAENFPSEGRYYPENIKILIKAATVNEIRHFSTIDENDPYSVDEAITDLLKVCVRVSYENSNKIGSWKDIKEEDKIYLILAIRELTFAENENRISFGVKCPSCKADNEMDVKNDNFQRRELDPKIASAYDEQDRTFLFKTKSYGNIKISPPSVGSMRVIAEYIRGLQMARENVKDYMPFLKVLPYLASDWRGLTTETINNHRIDFLRWDKNKFLLYTQLTEKLQVGVKEKMLKHCDACGEPIEAEVKLPSGIKGLFIESDILDNELL